ncbi:MAG: error-prone DNA polymerase, partial [Proteobacteria bacterium]|nr:error-prone DNA polymerase [Pseudomonadota bacterium]
AVRLGLRMIGGLGEAAAGRIVEARRQNAFDTVEALAQRARLDAHSLRRLAAGGALADLAGHRRQAHWQVAGVVSTAGLLQAAPSREAPFALPPPAEGDEIVADYASLGLTLGRHPLALLRMQAGLPGTVTAAALQTLPRGRVATVAGLVTCRQRPDTASGVVFVTLEDETGSINVIVWRSVIDPDPRTPAAEGQRRALLGARLLAVRGIIEREGEVVHLVARHLVDRSELLGRLSPRSRDFH